MLKRAGAWLLAAALVAGMSLSAEASDAGTVGDVRLLSTGYSSTGVVTSDHSLWMWGNIYRQDVSDLSDTFMPIKIADDVKSFSIGIKHYAVIKTDNSLWMWGENIDGQLGDGTRKKQYAPIKIMDHVAAVSLGESHSAAIKTDGSLWMWGLNGWGQIGDGTTDWHPIPIKIMDDVKSVSLYNNVSAAVKTDGSLWVWGFNGLNQVHSGTEQRQKTPLKIMDDIAKVSSGPSYSAAIKTDGSLWMWGTNNGFQMGNGTSGREKNPVKIMDDVAAVSLGARHSAVIKTDGSLWICGSNNAGQLGFLDPTKPRTSRVSTHVKIMDDVASVSLGSDFCIAIKNDGTIWVWGDNTHGQLGIGKDAANNGSYQNIPVQLTDWNVSPSEVDNQCTVTLNLNGGTGATSVQCEKGALLTPPNNPTREGYYFAGWYADSACVKPWNFDTDKVTDNITLYAKWEPKTTATVTAEPSTQKTVIDGKEMTFNTYILRDAAGNSVNFVKLRDVAYVLDGTAAQFNVDWRNNAIRLDAKQPYTTKNGAEMTVPSVVSAPAKTSETPVLTGGVTAPLEAFLLTDQNGGGHNYFKLRDIGKVAGFNVTWDNAAQSIVITTTEPYSG